jgi:hypothetical protein
MKIKFKVKGVSPALMHKFNGLDESKTNKQKSDKEQAECSAYRNSDGNLYMPSTWFRGALIEYFLRNAPKKGVTTEKQEVSPRIAVEPMMLDLNIKIFKIHKTAIPVKQGGRQVMDFSVKAEIEKWTVSGTIITTLDKSFEEIKRAFIGAGEDVGVGANKINGYGRFEVIEFELQS